MREAGTHRRRLAVGLGISAVVHAVALAAIQMRPAEPQDGRVARTPSEVAVQPFVERPIQVVELRQAPAARREADSGVPRTAAGSPARAAALPVGIPMPAALAAATGAPRLLLERVTVRADSAPAARSASVEDLLLSRAPRPGAMRPIDDRPVEVLAAIARAEGRSRGPGIVIGGGGGVCE